MTVTTLSDGTRLIELQSNSTTYRVSRNANDQEKVEVFVVKTRRATGEQYFQAIKRDTKIWRRVLRLAHTEATAAH